MKLAIVFAAVLAVSAAQFGGFQASRQAPRPAVQPARPAASRVASSDQDASVLRNDNDISPDGSYQYNLEINNGIAAQAQGVPRDFGGNPPVVPVVSTGSFSWISPEGQPISITYVADELGYRASGDAIPTPHPIPADIARAIEYLAKNQKK